MCTCACTPHCAGAGSYRGGADSAAHHPHRPGQPRQGRGMRQAQEEEGRLSQEVLISHCPFFTLHYFTSHHLAPPGSAQQRPGGRRKEHFLKRCTPGHLLHHRAVHLIPGGTRRDPRQLSPGRGSTKSLTGCHHPHLQYQTCF